MTGSTGEAAGDGPPASLAEALARFQADLPSVVKEATGLAMGQFGLSKPFDYADLAAVSEAILPRLGALGLSFSAMPTLRRGKFVLRYTLRHAGGEKDTGYYPLPEHGSPHTIGAHITYARRYSLLASTGVAPKGEDDGGTSAERAALGHGGGGRKLVPAAQAQAPGGPPAQQGGQPDGPAAPGDAPVDDTAASLARLAAGLALGGEGALERLRAEVQKPAERAGLLAAAVPDVLGDPSQRVALSAVINAARQRIEDLAGAGR